MPLPLAGLSQEFHEDLCRDRSPDPLPQPTPQPWSGGQCSGTRYQVFFTYTPEIGAPISSSVFARGPIGGIVKKQSLNWDDYVLYHGPTEGVGSSQFVVGNAAFNGNTVITSVIPNPAVQPNNCGDPAPDFPKILPPGVNPDDYGVVGGPPVGPGGQREYAPPATPRPVLPPPYSFTIPPVVWSPGGGQAPWRLPGTISIQPTISLSPQINVGPFNLNIGPNSINLTLNARFDKDNPAPQLPPGRDPGQLPQEDCCDIIEVIRERLGKVVVPGDYVVVPAGGGAVSQGFDFPVPVRCAALRVNASVIPQKASRQKGSGAPDVLWLGWVWFEYAEGRLSERMPIDASGKVFIPPQNWTWGGEMPIRVAGTLYLGVSADISIYNWEKVIES